MVAMECDIVFVVFAPQQRCRGSMGKMMRLPSAVVNRRIFARDKIDSNHMPIYRQLSVIVGAGGEPALPARRLNIV